MMIEPMPQDIWNWDVIFLAGIQLAGIGFGVFLVGLFIKTYCLYVIRKDDEENNPKI